MGEILEKGLVIGFGLVTSLLIISLFSPMFSTILSGQSSLDQYESFVLTMEYGFSYIPQFPDDELNINLSLTIQIHLKITRDEDNSYFVISSESKSTTLRVLRPFILYNTTVTGKVECVFVYGSENISLIFWGKN